MEYLPDHSLPLEPERAKPYEELFEMTLEEVIDYLINSPSEIGYVIISMALAKGLDPDMTFGIMAIALQRRVEKLEIRVNELETQIGDSDYNAECDARWASWKGLE